MSEREAMHEAPAWYVDLLLEGLRAETETDADSGETPLIGEDDWDAPLPEWAKAWRDVPEAAPNPAGRE